MASLKWASASFCLACLDGVAQEMRKKRVTGMIKIQVFMIGLRLTGPCPFFPGNQVKQGIKGFGEESYTFILEFLCNPVNADAQLLY